jgi:hypothetical protein
VGDVRERAEFLAAVARVEEVDGEGADGAGEVGDRAAGDAVDGGVGLVGKVVGGGTADHALGAGDEDGLGGGGHRGFFFRSWSEGVL